MRRVAATRYFTSLNSKITITIIMISATLALLGADTIRLLYYFACKLDEKKYKCIAVECVKKASSIENNTHEKS